MLCACRETPSSTQTNVDSNSVAINEWIRISKDSVELPMEKRKKFLVQARTKALVGITNDTIRLDHLSRISLAYKNLPDSLGFRKMNREVMKLSQEANMYMPLGESHWDLAYFLQSYGVMDSAYFHFRIAYKNFNRLPLNSETQSLKGRMLYSMGRIQDFNKDYLGAETNITEALKIFNDLEDNQRIYNCYNVLGIIASGMKNHQKSLEYYEVASTYLDKLNSSKKSKLVWQNKNNIAGEFLDMEDYVGAEKIYSELLQNPSFKSIRPKLFSLVMVSHAYTLFKTGGNKEKIKQLIDQGIKINDSLGDLYQQARAYQYYAEILASEGDTLNAITYAKEAHETAEQTLNNDRHLEVLKLLTQLDSKNALTYSNDYYELNEAIQEEERAKRDKFARIRLETDEVIQENEQLTRQKQIWIGAALGLILLGLAMLIIVSQRIHNNRLLFKQKQQESNQEIYNLMLAQEGKFKEGQQLEKKRVSEELHDGILGQMLGIRLILSGLNEKDDEASVEQRADLIEKLREVEEEIRTISHELSDASYQKIHNFIVSLEDLIEGISRSSGISSSFVYSPNVDWDNLQGDVKINIYRIIQESLQNCVKHAQCKNVAIDFGLYDGIFKLSISDDGVGFDSTKGKRGIGLRNVMSRVKKIKGTLKINSTKGKGTTLTVNIPYRNVALNNENTEQRSKKLVKA
ncbi:MULTISPECIES: sensor histidine kinase [Flavobacteriaceae]|uniref:sensor histidine kinase n=1 Tax=Flavobacteriaceae TaxID=49546 RepID=UPI0014921EEB|nr:MULTISPECIES: ATP-binding protein [Allomuricauda]MDC6364930.1 ATP-binding protein [Muricauda sp. AC10]